MAAILVLKIFASNYKNLQNVVDIFKPFILINDDFIKSRFEWLIGYPQIF